jgi:hypothetical protein
MTPPPLPPECLSIRGVCTIFIHDYHTRLDAMYNPIAAEVCSGQYTPRSPIAYVAEKSKGYAGNW